jgi:hypothetical protein
VWSVCSTTPVIALSCVSAIPAQESAAAAHCDEGAVRRLVGGPAVMKAQITWLIETSQRSNVQILVLPYAAGVGFDGSFVILNFPPLPAPYPDAAEDQMVYVDTLTGALYLERPAEVAAYSAAYEQLQALALGPKETRDTLSKIVADLAT